MNKRGLLLGIGTLLLTAAPVLARGFAAGHFALELDGHHCGMVHAATTSSGAIQMRVRNGMSPEVYDWIDEAVRQQGTPRNGAFSTLDDSNVEVERRTFDDLSIRRVVFPALDVHSTAAAAFTVEVAGATQLAAPSLSLVAGTIGPKQKAWVASNFKLEIDGMPTLHVTKIDALTWKMPAKVVLHMHAADAAPLRAWKKAADTPGAPLALREKEGRLAYEAIDGTQLFLLEVAGVTPNAIVPEALVIEGETFEGARIELGVRSGSLEALPAAAAP